VITRSTTPDRKETVVTVAPERPIAVAVRRGRDLVLDEDFKMLSEFCADEYKMLPELADRVIDQALAMVYVMGATRSGGTMSPSAMVDPGWHTLILHTDWYADFCNQHFGYFLHHQPNRAVRNKGIMGHVTGCIEGAGFQVDRMLWGAVAECNPPACCGDGDGC
jgi:hypothetical protein